MEFKVKLEDGKTKKFNKPMKLIDIAKNISPSFAKKCVYAQIKDKKYSLNNIFEKDIELKFITINDNIDLELNYNCKEMLIELIKKNFKNIKLISSSSNDKYFFIDFDYDNSFKENDLISLNNKLFKFSKNYISSNKNFIEPKFYNNFKFLTISGIYKNNDKNNKMINRIKGIVSFNKENLNLKIEELKKISESDHRVINERMKIFTFNSIIGQGLPIWLPNGVILKNKIQEFIKNKEREYKYKEIQTPILGLKQMYEKSGHLMHYSDSMFKSIKMKNEEFLLRPMSCPHHIEVFKNELYSYRNLPLRFSEHAYLFRYESSGSLTGLERVRMMNLTDSHIFVTSNQIEEEFKKCFNLIMEILKAFNIKIYYFSLSLHDKNNKTKFYNDEKMWIDSESKLKNVLDELKIEYKEMIGEAAFYGPKLDIQIKTNLEHEITISTIQLDFLTAKNFNATYINEKGTKDYPAIIHRGLIGTYERFISIILEQTNGILPLWLTPVQVIIIPVSDNVIKYCDELEDILLKENIRIEIDNSNERLNYKIRNAQLNKIPYQLIIGDKEKNKKNINYRKYGEQKNQLLNINDFIKKIKKQINLKK